MTGRRSRLGGDGGSVVLEAVLVIPIVMVLLLAVVQFALWSHGVQVAQLAASEGDRTAQAFGSGSAAGLARAEAVLRGPGSDVSAPRVTVATMAGGLVQITVSGDALSILPGISLPVSATQIGAIQEFRPAE